MNSYAKSAPYPVIPHLQEEFEAWKAEVVEKECRKAKAEGEAIGSLIDAIGSLINAIEGVIEAEEAASDIAEGLLSLIQSGKIPHIKFEVQE